MERILAHRIQRILRSLGFWAGATRAAFSSASMVSVVLGGAIAAAHGFFSAGLFLLSAAGVLALHLGANLVNDYYDYACGADLARNDRTPFYGGGTILIGGTLSPRQVSQAYKALFTSAFLSSLVLAALRGPGILALGLAGFLCGYFYTAPPFRLSYVGLGEATIGLCFGPLTVVGVYLVQAGEFGADVLEALVPSIPVGLLVAAIVFVNEFPDRATDAACGKRTLVVRLPLRAALAGYSALVLAPFAIIAAAIALGWLPRATALAYLALPLALLGIGNLRAAHGVSARRRPYPDDARDGSGGPRGCEEPSGQLDQQSRVHACDSTHPIDPSRGGYLAPRQVAASTSTILLHLAVGLLLSLGFTI
ncbi:MAG: prenyltransferase [Clostridia bacterium]